VRLEMSGNHFYCGLGVELFEIHDYQDDFAYLLLFDILGTIFNEFLQKTSAIYLGINFLPGFLSNSGFLPLVSSSFNISSSYGFNTFFLNFPLLSNRFSSSNQFSGQVRSRNFFLYLVRRNCFTKI
jgi:hypothetical protein